MDLPLVGTRENENEKDIFKLAVRMAKNVRVR
jgi:hypothetical protein